MAELDVKTRALLDLIAAAGEPPPSEQSVAEFRARRDRGREIVSLPSPELAVVREVSVAGAEGPLRARLYDVEDAAERPTLVYFHGGGFVYGGVDSHDSVCRRLAFGGGIRVISVEYRLAPEAPFPAAVEDAAAAARAVFRDPDRYGADPDRFALGGDSAGGCLATVSARRFARTKEAKVAYQLIVYPVVDHAETHSRRRFADGYFLTKAAMDWFHAHYLPPGTDLTDERVSPLRTPPPEGLAPAYVVTAGFDPLRDEGRAYAQALTRAGAAVEFVEYPDQIHGFFNFTAFSCAAVEAIDAAAKAVRRALG